MAKEKKSDTPPIAAASEGPEAPTAPEAPESGAVDEAEASVDIETVIAKTVGATMETVLQRLLPAAMAAGIRAASQTQLPDADKARLLNEALKPPDPSKYGSAGMNCPECRQPTGPKGGAYACHGRHRLAVVAPKDEDFWEFFQAPTINGVHYNSGLNRTPICVPADADIEGLVQAWELREKSYLKRRTFNGNASRGGAIDYSQRRAN